MAVQQHVLNWLYSVLTSEYQDVNRTYNDVAQALTQFSSLSPRTDVHTFPNGASALLLHLSGTIPAVFRGATYRYPISVWVPHAYPRDAPLVYVTPTENMMVRPGQHVDPQGQVYHPYLVGWSEFWDKSTLVDFLAILRDVFAKEPPVIARRASRPPTQPPSATPTPPPVPPLPQELAAHSRSSTAAAASPASSTAFQPPPPPPKPPTTASTASTASTATPPAAATGTPSPPPIPPHPSSGAQHPSFTGRLHDSPRLGSPSVLSPTLTPSPPPPVPGRPAAYQQSPLGQTDSYPQQQQSPAIPRPPQSSSASALPTAASFAGYDPRQLSYYQYPPQQQPLQATSSQVPPPQNYNYSGQVPPSLPWQQQQYQQLQQQQQPPARMKAPPPPDLMDEDDTMASRQQGQPSASTPAVNTTSATSAPPPVPPNPEKDALLQALARTLAQRRQQSRAQDASTLAGLHAQREAMVVAAQRLQQDMSDVAQLSALLTANTGMLHESLAAADAVVQLGRQTPPPAIDDLLIGPTVVAAQLYDLVAEERALADAVFMLGRAVEHGHISAPLFAKMTRSLAREWYLKKALVRKIARGMGLASA